MNWNLPSQNVGTDRLPNETVIDLQKRHEIRRRVQAEGDLIDALDTLAKIPEPTREVSEFLQKFK